MKQLLAFLFAISAACECIAADYSPPDVFIQHMSTAFAGQGMCAVRFSLETIMGHGDASTVVLNLVFRDKKNKVVARGEISSTLVDSSAGRKDEPILEGSEYCLLSDDANVVVTKARSEHEGKSYDLLKLKKIHVGEFKPYLIFIGPAKR